MKAKSTFKFDITKIGHKIVIPMFEEIYEFPETKIQPRNTQKLAEI